MPNQLGQQLSDIRTNDDFMVVGCKSFRDHSSIRQLIVKPIRTFKTYRVSFHWLVDHSSHCRDNGAGINTTTQKSSQRHVADQPNADTLEQLLTNAVNPVGLRIVFD